LLSDSPIRPRSASYADLVLGHTRLQKIPFTFTGRTVR
jgi:hypothetical protein